MKVADLETEGSDFRVARGGVAGKGNLSDK